MLRMFSFTCCTHVFVQPGEHPMRCAVPLVAGDRIAWTAPDEFIITSFVFTATGSAPRILVSFSPMVFRMYSHSCMLTRAQARGHCGPVAVPARVHGLPGLIRLANVQAKGAAASAHGPVCVHSVCLCVCVCACVRSSRERRSTEALWRSLPMVLSPIHLTSVKALLLLI